MVKLASATLIAGIDEAGRGPLAGPVVAAAVILHPDTDPATAFPGLNDSKRLSPTARARLEPQIKAHSLAWAVARAEVSEIDHHNILNATLLAMRRAVLSLTTPPDEAWVDGNRPPNLPCKTLTFIHGDSLHPIISAASILAKEHRDREMHRLHVLYPEYHFATNKGYGTRAHLAALEQHGPCEVHRRSFRPVGEWFLRG